jgi:2-C-methyl-D-erythritol 2,4-cyclodiphosphate synthase
MGASGVTPGEAQPAADVRPAGETRTAFATDAHPFGPEQGLWLGGVEIAAAPRLHGHSDGDAALHAIAGALLGAAGLGDLGSVYPADAGTRRGIASSELLRGVVDRLADSGWRPISIDLAIVAGRPRLADHLPAMRGAIAGLVGLAEGAVSVKGSTGNLFGDVGEGRVIEAHAVASVTRLGGAT